MRILMLGNSYSACNHLPERLAERLGATVIAHTRGGARLAEQCNPNTTLGKKTLHALKTEAWDYVILQEMSKGPAVSPKAFFQSVQTLCEIIRANGAVPVLFATWAYEKGSQTLRKSGMTYEEMRDKMHDAYAKAAERNQARLADVGTAFDLRCNTEKLYAADGGHPNERGTALAVEILVQTVQNG